MTPRPFPVTVRATVETDATPEFATFVRETERRCPVTQLFKRSGLELENQWTARRIASSVTSSSAAAEHANAE